MRPWRCEIFPVEVQHRRLVPQRRLGLLPVLGIESQRRTQSWSQAQPKPKSVQDR